MTNEHSVLATQDMFVLGDSPAREDLYALASTEEVKVLTLDMSKIPMINSYGVGIIFCLRRRLHSHEGALRLINTTPDVEKVIHILGLQALLLSGS